MLVGGNFWPYAAYELGLGARARFMAAGGELAACLHAVQAQWASFEVCAGAQAGAVIVATSGLADNARRVEPAARVQVGPRVRFALGPQFGLIARLEAAIPLIASHFYLTEADGEAALLPYGRARAGGANRRVLRVFVLNRATWLHSSNGSPRSMVGTHDGACVASAEHG